MDSHAVPAWQPRTGRLEQRETQSVPLVMLQHVDDVTQAMFGPQSASLAQTWQPPRLLPLSQQTNLPSMSVAQTHSVLVETAHCADAAGLQASPPDVQMFCGGGVVVVLVVVDVVVVDVVVLVVVLVVVDVVVLVVVVVGVAHVLVVGSQNPLQQLVFELQCLPLGVQGLGLAKTVPMLDRPRVPPMVAAIALRAWRREVAVARALVSSSKREGSMSLPSFLEAALPQRVGTSTHRIRTT